MKNTGSLNGLVRLALAVLLALASLPAPGADATNGPPATTEDSLSQDILRAYLQVQEQLHATQLALERNRQEAEAAAKQNLESLNTRLQRFEQVLNGERARQLETLQDSQWLMLIFAGVFAAVGLLAVLATAWVQWRAVSRLAGWSGPPPALPALAQATPLAALGPGPGLLVTTSSAESASLRLLAVIEKLEKRIQELEHIAFPAVVTATPPDAAAPGPPDATAGESSGEDAARAAAARKAAQLELLLAKGQTLLDLDRTEEALACFDGALELEPEHPEALVKKGAVLERGRKLDEAIACYDRAIAADRAFTMAYLHKGGLCNRLARHEEALKCYEDALKTQERKG